MKKFIRFLVTNFASREFAFIYCIIGTLAQTSHTYYLIESISSLSGWGKQLQAIGLSVFISSSLLFFTAIADAESESKEHKRIHFAVNLFMVIEILINSYYYVSHLLIKDSRVFDSIFALLVSCLIPVTIKLYAGVIQVRKWAIEDTVNVEFVESASKTETHSEEQKSDDGVVVEEGELANSHVVKLAESLNDALDKVLKTTPETVQEPPTSTSIETNQLEPSNSLPQLTGNFSSIKI